MQLPEESLSLVLTICGEARLLNSQTCSKPFVFFMKDAHETKWELVHCRALHTNVHITTFLPKEKFVFFSSLRKYERPGTSLLILNLMVGVLFCLFVVIIFYLDLDLGSPLQSLLSFV